MKYIHPDDGRIEEFIRSAIPDGSGIRAVCGGLLAWFDENVVYSRLNAPFFPLQRSDLDVLSMRSGTCGDYSNLIVSVLLHLGYEAAYAYVHRDCYGDEQDHICAAVWDAGKQILIDATLPYRNWYAFDCPHREYELLSPDAFEERMEREESCWMDEAVGFGDPAYAGLLYAPWIHERVVRRTGTVFETVFYLLVPDARKRFALHAYFMRYTREKGSIPMMSVFAGGTRRFRFSCKEPCGIWDDAQWTREYTEEEIPAEYGTEELSAFKRYVTEDLPGIDGVMRRLHAPPF